MYLCLYESFLLFIKANKKAYIIEVIIYVNVIAITPKKIETNNEQS